MFRNILIAIDGSSHGARALAEAIDLARVSNARLTIMTCSPDPSGWMLSGGAYGGQIDFEALRREAEREYGDLLDSAVAEVPAEIPVTKILAHAGPAAVLIVHAEAP